MRRRTIAYGLNLLILAVVLVIVTTFFSDVLATLFSFSSGTESRLIFLGLVSGACLGCAGIVVSVAGVLGGTDTTRDVKLTRRVFILAGTILLFFILFYFSLFSPRTDNLRPGDTITI